VNPDRHLGATLESLQVAAEETLMFLGQVVGTLVASVKHAAHRGHPILLVQPYTYDRQPDGPVFAAIDLADASPGTWVFYVKGREAANALPEPQNPSDRTIMGIVDAITLQSLREEDRLRGFGPDAARGDDTTSSASI